jgi:hypothetical protein
MSASVDTLREVVGFFIVSTTDCGDGCQSALA